MSIHPQTEKLICLRKGATTLAENGVETTREA